VCSRPAVDITDHVIRLQFERVRRAVGETPLEEGKGLVHFMLAIGVAHRTQDAHRLVADQIARRGAASALCIATSASYSVDLTQARKSSRRSCAPHAPGPAVCTCVAAGLFAAWTNRPDLPRSAILVMS
jgi:hypothetical protein